MLSSATMACPMTRKGVRTTFGLKYHVIDYRSLVFLNQSVIQNVRDYLRPIENGETSLVEGLFLVELDDKVTNQNEFKTSKMYWHECLTKDNKPKQIHYLDYKFWTRNLTHGQWACSVRIWPHGNQEAKRYKYKSVFSEGKLYRNDESFPPKLAFLGKQIRLFWNIQTTFSTFKI